MAPCDNWQLSLITRQGFKISLRKWPALWDVVQWVNKDKSIDLRNCLENNTKECHTGPHAAQPLTIPHIYYTNILFHKGDGINRGNLRAWNKRLVRSDCNCLYMSWAASCTHLHVAHIKRTLVCSCLSIFLCYYVSDLIWLLRLIQPDRCNSLQLNKYRGPGDWH